MNEKGTPIIEDEAIAWVIKMDDSASVDDEIRDAFDAWLNQDVRHAGAYARTQAAWRFLDSGNARQAGLSADNDEPSLPRAFSRRSLMTGSVAVAALSAGGAFLALRPRVTVERYDTRRGEIKRVPLGDGSVAVLNTGTRISFALGSAERMLTMESGEGWFDVAKDKSRAFVVDTGFAKAIAIGTAFAVRLYPARAEVTVTEGHVRLSSYTSDFGVDIDAGQRATVDDHGNVRLSPVSDHDIKRQLAWRDGGLGFDGEMVIQAATEFNRYNSRQIVVGPGTIGGEKIVGWFDLDDPQGFAESVATTFGGNVRTEGPTIHLSGKSEK